MSEHNMAFNVGDQVIHWIYGLGEIIQVDEKVLSGRSGKYYVVQTRDLTLWVPLNKSGEQSLRLPTPAEDFQKLFRLLASPGEMLSDDRLMRKTHLTELLRDGTLESICKVIRDLVHYKRSNKINENDKSILERAWKSLVSEWSFILSVPTHKAERDLRELLETSAV